MAPQQQKALVLPAKFGNFVVETIDVPKPGPGEVLIKIHTTALNPVDWKIQKLGIFYEKFPAILGTDIAGEIEELGEGVSSLKKGDKVFCQGTFDNEGASFQQYAIATANTLSKIPEKYSYDDVSTIPVTLTCSWVGLYNKPPYGLGFEPPVTPSAFGKYAGTPLVIFNGAGSVGQFVIQLAKANGFSPIIATASLKHTEYLKTLGATNIIDRNIPSSELSAEIKKITSKPITAVYDAVASPEMQQAGLNVLAPGGAIATVLPPDPNLKKEDGKAVQHVSGILKLPHNQALLKDMYSVLTKLLEDGHLKPNPLEVLPNGLAGIPGGLDRLEKNLVSGIKLVVHPFETP
ncbi:chaperonin 10-like protein [Cyathus striatus]|nr:chaperonin 10-like protein [Cyathus striatus]